MEACFRNSNPRITIDDTKFNHVVAALLQDVLTSIGQLIRLPENVPDHYDQFKAALTVTNGKIPAHAEEQPAH